MTDYRAKPGTLLMIGEAQAGQPWYHQSGLPVADMLGPKYFVAWRNELRPGDTIRLVRIESERVSELAEIMVIQVHADSIEHTQTRPIKKFPALAKPEAKPDPGPERYVDGDGYTVRNRGAAGWEVNDPEGNRVASKLSQEDAEAMRAGSMPLPEIKAAA